MMHETLLNTGYGTVVPQVAMAFAHYVFDGVASQVSHCRVRLVYTFLS